MRKPELGRYVPYGVDPKVHTRIFWILLAAASAFSMWCFFVRFAEELAKLPVNSAPAYELGLWRDGPEWYMRDFYSLMDGVHILFPYVVAVMLAFAPMYYLGHYSPSKSVYLMRRLPRRYELHLRCLALPLAAALIAALTAAALIGIYYAAYMLLTPDEALLPGQWQRFIIHFWSVIV